MRRLVPLALGCALLALPALAQQRLDPARLYPITTPIRNAGTVDVTTGGWSRGTKQTKFIASPIFNNTCTWTGGAYFAAFDWCDENYDEGRLYSPSAPNAPLGARVEYAIQSIDVSYCTHAGPLQGAGGYDMDVAFWDSLGGECVGAVPPTPPPVSSTATAFFSLAGLGLPGSTAVGFQACWVVTLDVSNSSFELAGDGDGQFDGVGADDKFVWMQRQNTTVGALNLPGTPDGFLVAGEPLTGGYGACSYSIPCGVDAISGETCGTGLDTFDAHWVNVDGVGVGASGQPAGCANSISQYGFGTNCYFFGGYPANPISSYWLVLESVFDPCNDTASCFCTQSKQTSVPFCSAISSVTDPSLATGIWRTTYIPRHASLGTGTVVGIYVYTHGIGIGPSTFSGGTPFGTLCITGFTRSGPALLPGAEAGVCNLGTMDIAANNLTGSPLAVGEDVNLQFWYRDPQPGNPGNANFGSAVFYVLQ